MTNVQVFLKTLFSFADVPNVADPVPSSVLMVEGQIVENRSGGVYRRQAVLRWAPP